MKKSRQFVILAVFVLLLSAFFTGCGKKYEALDKGVSGEIDIMVWSGTGVYMEDIGNKDLTAADFTGQNEAAIYALAKEFNKTYPNVKINVFAKAGEPHSNETTWSQEIENFKAEHGKYPDVYSSTDLSGDVARGMVADLSVFADDPMYKSFNKSIMNMMNYYGFQAGLPQFMQPWGVYVNKELAEQNNIDVPSFNWTIDEYTNFVSSSDNKTFWGAADAPVSFITTGTKDINYSLFHYKGTGDHVNLNSDAVNSLLNYIPKWSKTALWKQSDAGNVSPEIISAGGSWSFTFFTNNLVLTNDNDPWMMGTAANPVEDAWGRAQSNDWDIYPRPSTPYVGNTIGVVLDPLAVHNYAMDDGNPEWSEDEKAKLKLAYTFSSFWAGSTEGMQARANQNFTDNGTEKTCLNDSFPLVTGDEFDKQMEIWYSAPIHQRFADKAKMPGFQHVVELWEKGEIWDVSDKTYPNYVIEDGSPKLCLYEWYNIAHVNAREIIGAISSEANWLDQLKAKLGDWNVVSNERFVQAEKQLREGLQKYYGFTEDKLNGK